MLILFLICLSVIPKGMAQTTVLGVVKTSNGRCVDFANVIAAPSLSQKTILASAILQIAKPPLFVKLLNKRLRQPHPQSVETLHYVLLTAAITVPNRSGTLWIYSGEIVNKTGWELREVIVKKPKRFILKEIL